MHFTDEDLQAVQQCELFVDAPQTVCVALSDARCFSGDYAPDEMLYSEHSFERALGVIVHGTCDVIKRTPTGRSIAINRLARPRCLARKRTMRSVCLCAPLCAPSFSPKPS